MENKKQNLNIDIVSEIKDRLDIVDVVSELVVLKKSGKNYWGCCPFHKEKTPSFSVNPEKGIYKCFGCGAGGDAISFLMKTQNSSFVEVMTEQAQRFGLEVPAFGQSSEKTELKKTIADLNKIAANFYTEQLLTGKDAEHARNYLQKRGISDETVKQFNLGFAPAQYDSLLVHMVKKHSLKPEQIEQAGLILKRTKGDGYIDRFRNRLMIPIQDVNDNFIAFGARALGEDQNPKYLNSSDSLVFNKSKTLFGLNFSKEGIKQEDSVLVMEGYFDVITAYKNGLKNVVATCGTALTEQHIKLISKYTQSRKIYLAFDSDNAGVNAANRGAEVIKSIFEGIGTLKEFDDSYNSFSSDNKYSCEVRVVSTKTGKDPDEFIKSEGVEAYRKQIKNAPLLIDFQIKNILDRKKELKTPQDKAKVLKDAVVLLGEIKNSIVRHEYVKRISEHFEVDESTLLSELNNVLSGKKPTNRSSRRIVTKSSKKHIFAQKKLLSLFFISSEHYTLNFINKILKEVNFTEPEMGLIKSEIEKLSETVSSAEELSNELFKKLADNEEAKELLVDILFSLDDVKSIKPNLLNEFIKDAVVCIEDYQRENEQSLLRTKYREANNDEMSSLQYQYKLREEIKARRSRMELLNGEKN